MLHATFPSERIGLNREYDKDAPPLEDVLRDGWRPAKPELTDAKCHVLKFIDKANGNGWGHGLFWLPPCCLL